MESAAPSSAVSPAPEEPVPALASPPKDDPAPRVSSPVSETEEFLSGEDEPEPEFETASERPLAPEPEDEAEPEELPEFQPAVSMEEESSVSDSKSEDAPSSVAVDRNLAAYPESSPFKDEAAVAVADADIDRKASSTPAVDSNSLSPESGLPSGGSGVLDEDADTGDEKKTVAGEIGASEELEGREKIENVDGDPDENTKSEVNTHRLSSEVADAEELPEGVENGGDGALHDNLELDGASAAAQDVPQDDIEIDRADTAKGREDVQDSDAGEALAEDCIAESSEKREIAAQPEDSKHDEAPEAAAKENGDDRGADLDAILEEGTHAAVDGQELQASEILESPAHESSETREVAANVQKDEAPQVVDSEQKIENIDGDDAAERDAIEQALADLLAKAEENAEENAEEAEAAEEEEDEDYDEDELDIRRIMKALEEGSSAPGSDFRSSQNYGNEMDGQIVSDSEEEEDLAGGERQVKELFDPAALTALLKAAAGASSDGTITISAEDAVRTSSVDRPAGLGSSIPSLKPAPARSLRSTLFSPSDTSLQPQEDSAIDEEDRKLQEKVDQIRVKFLRLVHRLGHSPEDRVATQVLYRLGLAEGIKRGRQIGRGSSLENAKKTALHLEAAGGEPLDFSCNILIIGKTGGGKSATINSIFGEEKVPTSAFESSTKAIRSIVGCVDGIKLNVTDTPGLKPSVMDQAANRKILEGIKRYTKRCPPDIVLYVDRLDTQTWDFNDLPLLRSVTATLGSSIWFNAIVALTHAASAPPDGPTGMPLSYEAFIDQRSRVVQHAIRQAAGDMRLMNPVALVENHPLCRKNREGQRILPNGLSWRQQLLLLCYSSKILSEANSLLKLQEPSPGKMFGFRVRSPPLPFLLSSLLQSRPHPKLAADSGGDNGDSDVDLGELSDSDREEEEDEYDQLPPFKPLRKAQLAKLTKEQRKAYYEEYEYRVKLLQKKQWKEEIKRLKEVKKMGGKGQEEGLPADDFDQDGAPAAVPVPLPDMVLPPSFDSDNPVYRFRFLEPASQMLARPVLDSHGWDHDCGYDGVSLEESLAVAGRFPAAYALQLTKDKKEFNVHFDSSVSVKHGDTGSTLTGFDVQTVGKQLAYILRGESKLRTSRRNKAAAGVSLTLLGEHVAAGLKVEDQLLVGKRLGLVASSGAVRAQGDVAYGANVEVRLRDREFPVSQDVSTLGLSLMRWRGDLALGANLQSQVAVGRGSKVAVRVGLNNKLSGQITIRTSTSEQLQIALLGVLPIAATIYRSLWSVESY